MLGALLVTWTTQTTRSHAYDYNTAADEATRDFRQMESQRQAVADLQAQTRNQAQMRDLQAQPAFDPRSYTGPQPFNFTGPNG